MRPFRVRPIFWNVCVLAVLVVLAQGCALSADVNTAPKLYWGVFMDGVPWDMNKLSSLETEVNKKVSLVHWGQPWWHCYSQCGYQSFNSQLEQYDAVRLHGAVPFVDWASWDYSADPYSQPKFSLKSIIEGDHDAYIREWATQARQWGHPFFLRMNWEMNGNWYPWSEVRNGNQRGEYAKAWRHVHDIFTNVGAKNVTWVWCTSIEYENSLELGPLYPGDDYVDWVAMDGFNWAHNRNASWRSFEELFAPTYDAFGKLAPNKPIMIAEVGSPENVDSADPTMSKSAWIEDAFTKTLPQVFPKIKAVAWFHWNQGNSAYTWQIDTSRESLQAFKRGISSKDYAENIFANIAWVRVEPLDVTINFRE